MSNKIVRSALAIGLSIIFCFESGCSSIRPAAPMSPEQTAKLQERLGNIGVVSVRYTPRVELQTPGKGQLANAERGAADLSRMTLGAGAAAGSPEVVIVAIILSPIMAVAGGVGGALMADSPSPLRTRKRHCTMLCLK